MIEFRPMYAIKNAVYKNIIMENRPIKSAYENIHK